MKITKEYLNVLRPVNQLIQLNIIKYCFYVTICSEPLIGYSLRLNIALYGIGEKLPFASNSYITFSIHKYNLREVVSTTLVYGNGDFGNDNNNDWYNRDGNDDIGANSGNNWLSQIKNLAWNFKCFLEEIQCLSKS